MINQVTIGGNLTRDPEIRYTPKGTPLCEATLANSKRWKTEDGQERESTVFVSILIWGNSGKAFAEHHRKGDIALVEGELAQEHWEDKETKAKREKTKVKVSQWHWIPKRQPKAQTGAPTPAVTEPPAELPTGVADQLNKEDDVPF